ncbi:hypothetical protein PQX77_008340 [Marasmius sp. AFHP31]|nr:hypothetical protein PQX77_008340 [Marasmius sp. AFHP31]
MEFRYRVFHEHPHLYLGTASVVTSVFALAALPSFLPMVLHLTILLIYAPKLFPRNPLTRITPLWLGLSIGRSISWISPSLHALDTPGIAVLVLLAQSMVTSAISLTAVLLYTKLRTRFSSGSTQATIFPAIWSAIWCAVAYVSPVGYLTSWTPVTGVQFYEWLAPFLGPAARDWTVAAWAVVLSQAIEGWVMDSQAEEETPLISDFPRSSSSSAKDVRPWYGKNWKALGLFLVVLAVPSYVINNRPLPVISSDSTPLAVACALPPYQRYKNHKPTLEDYKSESSKLVSLADLILWPEGAVSFDSEVERDAAFDDIRKYVQLGDRKWIGVAFDETYADPQDPKGERGIKRTGLALLSNSSQTHLVYYKRHLVPSE